MRTVGPQDVYMVITAAMNRLLETLENNRSVDEHMRWHRFWIIRLRCVCDPRETRVSVNCWYVFKILLYVRQFSFDWKLAEAFHSWPLDNSFFLSSGLLAICLLCCKHAGLCNPTFNDNSTLTQMPEICFRLWNRLNIVILTWLWKKVKIRKHQHVYLVMWVYACLINTPLCSIL